MANPIEINPEALQAFKQQLALRDPKAKGVRLGVKGGACFGLLYYVGFEDSEPADRDLTWQLDGVTFMVDKKSLQHLSGSTVTWKKTLMKTGFEFENPNEASKCGCGHSFAVK